LQPDITQLTQCERATLVGSVLSGCAAAKVTCAVCMMVALDQIMHRPHFEQVKGW
jgi:hypothetical protein